MIRGYQIGMTTAVPATRDLIHYPVITEPMAIVNAGERATSKATRLRKAIAQAAARHLKSLRWREQL